MGDLDLEIAPIFTASDITSCTRCGGLVTALAEEICNNGAIFCLCNGAPNAAAVSEREESGRSALRDVCGDRVR